MGIGIQGEADGRVAQPLGYYFDMDPLPKELGSVGVPLIPNSE